MAGVLQQLDAVLSELKRARAAVAKKKSIQVTSAEELDYLKSIVYAWFQTHRPVAAGYADNAVLADADEVYRRILNSTGRSAARATYRRALGEAADAICQIRSFVATALPRPNGGPADEPADFDPLAADPAMRAILVRRWGECLRCLQAGAHLAATVMMGGLLEALFVARANKLLDKTPLFKAKSAPRDPQSKKTLPLKEWTLRAYIDVAFELGWITQSGKDVGAVLRDYRNYVHPQKEYSHGVVLAEHDTQMFWQVTKSLTDQILASVELP